MPTMAISPTTTDLQIKLGDQAPLKEAGNVDHLSNLSDELLGTILSLLPTRNAVRISGLICRRFQKFHGNSIQDQAASLHNRLPLESMNLARKDAQMYYKRNQQRNQKNRKSWQSKLYIN